MRPIDENGWLVPKDGTKARLIYGLAKAGLKATAIQPFLADGTTLGCIRVHISRIRNPHSRRRRQLFPGAPASPR